MVGCHGIERALSLPRPRKGFGIRDAEHLIGQIESYLSDYGTDETVASAIAALQEYRYFSAGVEDFEVTLRPRYEAVCNQSAPEIESTGGTVEMPSGKSWQDRFDFEQFVRSRRSIRNFSGDPVPAALLNKAVALARHAPSACNRQSCHTHVISDKRTIEYICTLQGGTRGFTECIDKLLLITSDLSTCTTVQERNQPWIDGGLFAMNLLLALHYLGAGACILNWNTGTARDRAVRKAIQLSDSDVIVVRIAVGCLPDTCRVPVSWRYPTAEYIRWHA